MLRLFRTRALGRLVAMIALLCAVVALQPVSHAHVAPLQHGQHDGHDHGGHNHGPGGHADGEHGGAALPDACCHLAVSGCGGATFLPAAMAGDPIDWHRSSPPQGIDPSDLSGRTTAPEHRPPRASS